MGSKKTKSQTYPMTVQELQDRVDKMDREADAKKDDLEFERGRTKVFTRAKMMFDFAVQACGEWIEPEKNKPNFDLLPTPEKTIWIAMAQMALRSGDPWDIVLGHGDRMYEREPAIHGPIRERDPWPKHETLKGEVHDRG